MGRFEGFYSGGEVAEDNGNFSGSNVFKQKAQERELQTERDKARATRIEQYKAEFNKCNNQKTLQAYINKYKTVNENPYVKQAMDKLDDMTFEKCKNGNENDVNTYISKYPNGRHLNEAKNLASKKQLEGIDKEKIRVNRKELTENIFYGIAMAIFVIVFCLTFFGTELSFFAAAGIALGSAGPIIVIYEAIVKPFFD